MDIIMPAIRQMCGMSSKIDHSQSTCTTMIFRVLDEKQPARHVNGYMRQAREEKGPDNSSHADVCYNRGIVGISLYDAG